MSNGAAVSQATQQGGFDSRDDAISPPVMTTAGASSSSSSIPLPTDNSRRNDMLPPISTCVSRQEDPEGHGWGDGDGERAGRDRGEGGGGGGGGGGGMVWAPDGGHQNKNAAVRAGIEVSGA